MKVDVKIDKAAFAEMIRNKRRAVATAAVAALRETAANAVQEGRSNIASAGRFGPKWQSGLQYRTRDAAEGGEASLQARAIVFHKIGYASVFEEGATIQGKPLLWIPTQRGGPSARRSGKKLTFATVGGQPMAFDADDKDRKRKPLYIGVPEVRIEPRFRIAEIVKEHAAKFAELFSKHFKDT